jgi:hypothetical protein
MLSPQLGQAAFRIATFLFVVSLGLLLFVKPGSAEFVVTVITLGIGIVLGTTIAVLVRRQARQATPMRGGERSVGWKGGADETDEEYTVVSRS